MWSTKQRWIGTGLLIAALALSGCTAQRGAPPASAQGDSAKQKDDEPAPVPGYRAPNIVAIDARTNQRVELASLKGQVVMVNFWATWCLPCRKEMPDLETFSKEAKGKVAILAVGGDSKEGPQALAAFANEMGLSFPVVYDKGAGAEAYGIVGIPTTFFVDQNGIVRTKYQGAMTLAKMRQLAAETEQMGQQKQP